MSFCLFVSSAICSCRRYLPGAKGCAGTVLLFFPPPCMMALRYLSKGCRRKKSLSCFFYMCFTSLFACKGAQIYAEAERRSKACFDYAEAHPYIRPAGANIVKVERRANGLARFAMPRRILYLPKVEYSERWTNVDRLV